jgi:hypothetical protein
MQVYRKLTSADVAGDESEAVESDDEESDNLSDFVESDDEGSKFDDADYAEDDEEEADKGEDPCVDLILLWLEI